MEWSWWFVVVSAVTCVVSEPRSNVLVSLNSFKRLRLVSDNFLSLSVSPGQLLTVDNISETTMSLLEGLAPAYLQVGGPESDNFTLQTLDSETASTSHTFTESQWSRLNLLAADTGLNLVFTLSTNISQHEFHALLSTSDTQGFNPTYQYGSEMSPQHQNIQTLKKRIAELRTTLDSFPRYRNTALLCPDIQIDDDATYVQELQEFLAQSNDVPPVYILHGKPIAVKNERAIVESLREPMAFMNKVLNEQTNKTPTVQTEKKYQLWIADSKDAKQKGKEGSWSAAVVWTLRLGHAARQGYQTFLWHPTQLTKPTLEYWVSLLHRRVVGGAVLNTRVVSGSSSGLSVFAHCAAQEIGRGAVTVWGVNLAREAISVTLLTTFTPRVHVYSLTLRDNELLLNGHPLSLSHGALPKLSPEVRQLSSNMSVDIDPQSIFFLVLPDLRARACLSPLAASGNEEVNHLLQREPILTSTKQAQNFIIEKGGIFQSSEDDQLKNTKLTDQLKNIQKIIETDRKPAASSKTVEKVEDSVEDWLEKLAIVNKSGILTQDEMEILTELIIDERPPGLEKNMRSFESIEKITNERFKRSGNLEAAQILSNRLSLPVSSPLFRKLYFLRKSRPLDVSNILSPKSLGEINPTIETKTEGLLQNEIVTSSAKPNIPVDANEKSKLDKKTQLMPKLQKNEESESIHYYPGEFYEMLGSLKIQSDVPLKDLTDSHEATGSILSEEQNCKDCESKLQVITKSESKKKEDDKVIESVTDDLRDHFNKGERSKPSSDVSARKANGLVEQKYQSEVSNSESAETKANKQVPNNIPRSPMFINSETSRNIATQKRRKREADSYKYVTHLFKNDNQEEISDSTTINSSEEKELRQFLEELTVEGEELLEDFHENVEQRNTNLKYNLQAKKSKETRNLGNEEDKNKDYFLKNNLVVEEKPKTRRTYSPRLVLVSQSSSNKKLDNDWKTVDDQVSKKRNEEKSKTLITEKIPDVVQAVTFIRTTEKIPEYITTEESALTSSGNEQTKSEKKFKTGYGESSKHDSPDVKTEIVKLNYYPTVADPLKNIVLSNPQKDIELEKYPTVIDPPAFRRKNHKLIKSLNENIAQKPANIENPHGNTDLFTSTNSHTDEEKSFKSKIPLLPNFNRNILQRYLNPLAAPTTYLRSFQNSPSSTDKNDNDKQFVDSSEVEVETPPLLKLILANKRKNRLDSIRKRIAQARERMVRLPKPRNLPAQKNVKKEDVSKKTTFPVEIEPAVDISNSADKKTFQRKKRQAPEDTAKGKLEIEEITPVPNVQLTFENKTLEVSTTTEVPTPSPTSVEDHISDQQPLTEELPIDDVLIESSQIPLKKWIIPLSNHTEKIILKNQIFPVKLYGILHDDWAKEKNTSKSNDVIESPNKEKRSVQYSCIKDRFYDDAMDEETQVVNKKGESKKLEQKMSPSEISEIKLPKEKTFTEIIPILILSPEHSQRTKRSITDKTSLAENKLNSLLTNEIFKEEPREGDSGSQEQEDSFGHEDEEEEGESDFNIMLRKSVKEAAAHNSGIERMLALAKEYKKTNPDSLEIFDIHRKKDPEQLRRVHIYKKESQPQSSSEHEDKIQAFDKNDRKNLTSVSKSSDEKEKQNKKKNETTIDESDSSGENLFLTFFNKTKEYFNNMNLFVHSPDDYERQSSEKNKVDQHTNHSDLKSSNSTSANIFSSIFNTSKDFLHNVTTYIEKNWDLDSKIEDD